MNANFHRNGEIETTEIAATDVEAGTVLHRPADSGWAFTAKVTNVKTKDGWIVARTNSPLQRTIYLTPGAVVDVVVS